MELWDGYFKDGSPAGIILIRGNPVPKGIYHLACDVIVRHVDGTILLMKRDESKETSPGLYEATAGGAALKGESKEACALRELREETGITATKLTELFQTVDEEKRTIFVNYLCETDCDKNDVTLQKRGDLRLQMGNGKRARPRDKTRHSLQRQRHKTFPLSRKKRNTAVLKRKNTINLYRKKLFHGSTSQHRPVKFAADLIKAVSPSTRRSKVSESKIGRIFRRLLSLRSGCARPPAP